jgi:hypothetical protein
VGGVINAVTDGIGITNHSGDRATQAQTQASKEANATQMQMYNQSREDMTPWRTAGANALNQLTGQMSDLGRSFTLNDFQQDPGYQFRMNQGQQALERSAAARGGLMNGGTLKSLARYGQDYASNEYQNAYNRFNNDRDRRFNQLSSIAGVGQTASSQLGNAAMQTGQNIAQNQIGLGNAIAANNLSQANRMGQAAGMAAGVGSAMILASDINLKTNIEPVSKEDLQEIKDKVRAYKFNYKNKEQYGEGDFVGVMAQDLEQTKLGKGLVYYDKEGYRMINTQKLMSLLLATLAEA